MSNDIRLRILPVLPSEDGGTGHLWIATIDVNDVPAWDASSTSIEHTLALLCVNLATELEEATRRPT